MNLLSLLTFLLGFPLELFLSSDHPFCNSSRIVFSGPINFPLTSDGDPPFHRAVFDYSCTDWDGFCDHPRDVDQEILIWILLLLLPNVVSVSRLKSLIESNK